MTPRFVVGIFGHRPSFAPSDGPLMALVAVQGVDEVLVDRERNRARVDRTPARTDLEKWCTPVGLILAARRDAWGLSILEDRYAGDPIGLPALALRPRASPWYHGAPRDPIPVRPRFLRASVPRDLCSCLRCRDLVIARRSRDGRPGVALAAPGRLYAEAYAALWDARALSSCQGPGAAGVEHGRDCTGYRLADSGPIRRGGTARGRLLAQLLRLLGRGPLGPAIGTGAGGRAVR